MSNSKLKIPGRTSSANPGAKLVKSTTKAVKKNAQFKAAKKAVTTAAKKTGTRTQAAVFLAVGATTAAGAFVLKKRGGDEQQAQHGGADLTDPAIAAGV